MHDKNFPAPPPLKKIYGSATGSDDKVPLSSISIYGYNASFLIVVYVFFYKLYNSGFGEQIVNWNVKKSLK
uniref:ATP synthase F0 subunit 8 n=1 Tax=Romanomermis culicivorax TaxID=13658 RepID=A0A915KS28_ROMCU